MIGLSAACFLVLSLAVPAGASHRGEPPTSLSSGLHRLVTMPGGPPGAIALVQVDRAVRVTTAGVGNVVTKAPPSSNDTVRIASVSKAFSGAVALSLVTHRKLRLGDTIGKRLPALPESWGTVTLAELLQHTSGLPDYIHSDDFIDVLKADPHAVLTPIQLLSYVTDDDPEIHAGYPLPLLRHRQHRRGIDGRGGDRGLLRAGAGPGRGGSAPSRPRPRCRTLPT